MADEFDWDEANISHVARHDVMPAEIEEVFGRPHGFDIDECDYEERFRIYGITAQGRYLTVVYTERNGRMRPITAWDMTQEEMEQYADDIYH
jgi:uncharacterized DUF497 family protein